jgi:hypothetical protein
LSSTTFDYSNSPSATRILAASPDFVPKGNGERGPHAQSGCDANVIADIFLEFIEKNIFVFSCDELMQV